MRLRPCEAAFRAFVGSSKVSAFLASPEDEFSAGGAWEFDRSLLRYDYVPTPDTCWHEVTPKFYREVLRDTCFTNIYSFQYRHPHRHTLVEGKFLVKQVIVVRRDLRMGTGKLVGQACHACLGASEEARKHDLNVWNRWLCEGAKKVVVKVYSLEELLELELGARRLGLPNALIVDRGLTQLPPETPTSLGIGPAEGEVIDKLTGRLKLL